MDGGVLRTENKSAAERRYVRRPTDRSRLARLVGLRLPEPLLKNAESIAEENRFLWPLEFPDIFQHGGFDVELGNLPSRKSRRSVAIEPGKLTPPIAGAGK